MNREDLREFVFNPGKRTEFIISISKETDDYEKCLRKLGSSCPITVTGNCEFSLDEESVRDIQYFLSHYPNHISDYILNALLLDDQIKKDESVSNLLHLLTSS